VSLKPRSLSGLGDLGGRGAYLETTFPIRKEVRSASGREKTMFNGPTVDQDCEGGVSEVAVITVEPGDQRQGGCGPGREKSRPRRWWGP